MAGPVLAVQQASDAGITPNYQAAAAAQEVPNASPVVLHVKTNATGPANVSLVPAVAPDADVVANRVVNIPANSERIIGPIPRGVYNMADGNVQVNIDTPANVVGIAVYAVVPLP